MSTKKIKNTLRSIVPALAVGMVILLMSSGISALSAQSPVAPYSADTEQTDPYIKVYYPPDDLFEDQDNVLIKGRVENTSSLWIDNTEIQVSDDGKFNHRVALSLPFAYHHFGILAESPDGAKKLVERKVFYKPIQKNLFGNGPAVSFLVGHKPPKNVYIPAIDPERIVQQNISKSKDPAVKFIIPVEPQVKTVAPKPIANKEAPVIAKQEVVVAPVPEVDKASPVMAKKPDSPKMPAVVAMESAVERPSVVINSPANNYLTYKDNVTISGSASHVKQLYINSRSISLDKSGRFSEMFSLKKLGKYMFNVFAVGEDNLTAGMIRKVFRVSKTKPTPKPVNPSVKVNSLEKILASSISLELEGADIKDVFKILAKQTGLNIVSDVSISGEVNILVKDIPLRSAIEYILDTQGLSYKLAEHNTLIIADASNLDKPTQLKTTIIKMNNIKAADAEPILQTYLSTNESVKAVAQDNLLVIHADPKKTVNLVAIANRIDEQVIPQVFLVAQIVEVSTLALNEMGVAWPNNASLGADSGPFEDFEFTFSISPWILRVLEQKGEAKILAKPQIKVVNEEDASIFIGDRLPYMESTTDQAGRLTETVKYVDTGIILNVTPYINPQQGQVKLDVNPEVIYVSGYKGKNNDVPILRTRKVNTTVWVQDGDTVAIGGLFNSSDTQDVVKLPLLGDIPLLGNLFASTKNEGGDTELVITVTPRIVRPLNLTSSPSEH